MSQESQTATSEGPPRQSPVPTRRRKAAPSLTLGELIAAAFDVVGQDPEQAARLLQSRELRRRTSRRIAFI